MEARNNNLVDYGIRVNSNFGNDVNAQIALAKNMAKRYVKQEVVFQTISSAVEASPENAIIYVDAGDYVEQSFELKEGQFLKGVDLDAVYVKIELNEKTNTEKTTTSEGKNEEVAYGMKMAPYSTVKGISLSTITKFPIRYLRKSTMCAAVLLSSSAKVNESHIRAIINKSCTMNATAILITSKVVGGGGGGGAAAGSAAAAPTSVNGSKVEIIEEKKEEEKEEDDMGFALFDRTFSAIASYSKDSLQCKDSSISVNFSKATAALKTKQVVSKTQLVALHVPEQNSKIESQKIKFINTTFETEEGTSDMKVDDNVPVEVTGGKLGSYDVYGKNITFSDVQSQSYEIESIKVGIDESTNNETFIKLDSTFSSFDTFEGAAIKATAQTLVSAIEISAEDANNDVQISLLIGDKSSKTGYKQAVDSDGNAIEYITKAGAIKASAKMNFLLNAGTFYAMKVKSLNSKRALHMRKFSVFTRAIKGTSFLSSARK